MEIEVEPGDGLAIYSQTMHWTTPRNDQEITPQERARIMTRILAALDQLGIDGIPA
jgi:hypothetical protein